uniref:Uncharacterized protein n=1 Tax=viral metagenome TaxID=1070528 RepID=A0A6M3KRH8_9ZZZZ
MGGKLSDALELIIGSLEQGSQKVEFHTDRYKIKAYRMGSNLRVDLIPQAARILQEETRVFDTPWLGADA